jgi:D-xylonolactonase
MNPQIECVVDANNLCGETPVWDFRCNRLVWNDQNSCLVYEYDPLKNQTEIISRNLMVACIALNGESGFAFAGSTGFHLWERNGEYQTLVSEDETGPLYFNDMLAAPDGSVYANTMYWNETSMEKTGKLYKIKKGKKLTILDDNFELANGMGLSPDNRLLYLTDSARRVIYVYDVNAADGKVYNRRVFAKVPDEEGIPDGLTVDAEGFVWNAQWYGSQIVRYDLEGKVERRIPVPAKQVSCVAFGGVEMTDLYITTAGESWPSALMPNGYDPKKENIGGALYRLRNDIAGKREYVADLAL